MFRSVILFVASTIASAAAVSAAEPLSNTGVLLDRVVAIVNEGILLQSQLDSQSAMIMQQLRAQGAQIPPREILDKQVLEQLIVQEVQMQRARRLSIRVPDSMLNASLAQVAERNGLTLSDLPRVMSSQGIDYGQYREDMRREMILDSLHQRDVVAQITVREREIQRYLQREEASAGDQVDYDLSQILVALPSSALPDDIASAEQKISMIGERLASGGDFGELALEFSDGQNALAGGELGWRKGAQLPAVFADVVRDMEPGQFSSPVRSPSGIHILKVNDVRGTELIIVLQTHIRHILLRPDQIMDDQAVRQKLTRMRQRIVDGDDFEDVARLQSEDPGSATRGGDLGWTNPGDFPPVFEEQVARLVPGEISQPFRTDFGWHIVLLEDRKERDTTDEVRRQRAIAAIRASKREQETEIWLRQIRDEAYVEIRG